MTEASDAFLCFGGTCAVLAGGDGARGAVGAARRSLLAWHDRFTRFDRSSELSRLNADPREIVPVTPLMARLAAREVGRPRDGRTWRLQDAGVATSGIGRRSWLADGRPAHHLLDPATGRPAFTGVVQATAVAPTALEAEMRAKAAVLSGPDDAAGWLPHGGVVVLDDGSHRAYPASAPPSAAASPSTARRSRSGPASAPSGCPSPTERQRRGSRASTRAAMPDCVSRP